MQNLHCVMCGKITEAHDYADAVICDSCDLPTGEVDESSENTNQKNSSVAEVRRSSDVS